MFRTGVAAALLATLALGAAQASPLDPLRWKNRVLVLSAAHAGSGDLAEQERLLLADRDALAERDLVVIALEEDGVRDVFGAMPDRATAAALHRQLRIDPAAPFRAVLVGKDGGVKWTADAPADPAAINAVIDAMPMRRAGGS